MFLFSNLWVFFFVCLICLNIFEKFELVKLYFKYFNRSLFI